MAKPLEKVIRFPVGQVLKFPNPKVQCCGHCDTEINEDLHDFIKCRETGKWYCDMICFLNGVDARISGSERWVRFNACPDFRYSVTEFFEEMGAYWNGDEPA